MISMISMISTIFMISRIAQGANASASRGLSSISRGCEAALSALATRHGSPGATSPGSTAVAAADTGRGRRRLAAVSRRSRRIERQFGLVLEDLQLPLDQSLDRSQVNELIVITERHGNAGRARPGRAADAVNVRLGNIGDVEVDDVRDVVDIDAPRGDIGCNQHWRAAGLESGQCASPSGLVLVAVNRPGLDARPVAGS